MIKTTLFYIISNAISRGAFIFYSFFLLKLMSLENFGLYNLVYILSMLISPILIVGGGSSILREGVKDSSIAFYLLKKYIALSTLISGVLFTIIFFFDKSEYNWLLYTILLSSMEAILLLILAYFRAVNCPKIYLLISLIKFSSILTVFYIAYKFNFLLNEIFQLQFNALLFISLSLIFYIFLKTNNVISVKIDNYQVFMFGLLLIPHGLSQWIMSSSDRVLIKFFLTNKELGIYSLGYIMASILLLINSGIGLALPQEMIKDYKKWKNNRYDIYWIKLYSISSIVLLLLIECFFLIDKNFLFLLKYYTFDMYLIFSFVYAGISILGFYYFYANYLFYHRKSKLISTQTFIAACVNIVLTSVLLILIGVTGAAVATMLSYLVYLTLVKKEALKLEKELIEISREIDKIFYKLMTVITLLFCFFYIWW